MNRSFWTAATSSGMTVNSPATKWLMNNDAETIFNRLEDHGKSWKVYVAEPMQFSATAVIHYPRLKDRWPPTSCPSPSSRTTPPAGTWPTSPSSSRVSSSVMATTTPPPDGPWGTAWTSRGSTHRRRSSAARRSCHGSTTPTGGCSPRPGPTSGTPPCSSAGTNRAAPTTTYRPRRFPLPTRLHRQASAASPSTARATEFQPSSSPRGWPKATCSTTSTVTRR